jgi:hypothetical protein
MFFIVLTSKNNFFLYNCIDYQKDLHYKLIIIVKLLKIFSFIQLLKSHIINCDVLTYIFFTPLINIDSIGKDMTYAPY